MYLSMGPLEISPTNCNFSSKPRTLTWFRLFILCFFPRLTTWSKFQGQRRIFVRPEGSSFGSRDCGMPHYQPNFVPRLSRLQGEQKRENLRTRLLSTSLCLFWPLSIIMTSWLSSSRLKEKMELFDNLFPSLSLICLPCRWKDPSLSSMTREEKGREAGDGFDDSGEKQEIFQRKYVQ